MIGFEGDLHITASNRDRFCQGCRYLLDRNGTVVKTVDAIFLSGSNIVGETIRTIVGAANRERVITVSHLDDLVKKGALLGVTGDSYRLGGIAGKKAAMILRGVKPADIPIEGDSTPEVILNRKSAEEGKFDIPASFMKKVTEIVE